MATPRPRRFDLEHWSDADKVLLISALTLPFAVAWLLRVLHLEGDPTRSPYVNRAFLPVLTPFLRLQAAGHVALILAALARRRNPAPRAPGLVHAEAQFWFACMAFSLYAQGTFTSSFGAFVLALPVLGYQLFEPRPMHLGMVTLLTGVALGIVLPLAGVVPYAPFVAQAPFADGRLHPAWLVSIGLPSLGAMSAVLAVHISVTRRLRARQAELERLSQTDGLTGLYNRAVFFERLETELERSRRHGLPVCVVMLDVDHFKRLNDTRGHLVGDAVLAMLAASLKATVRTHDVAARYGGEEFGVVLPHASLEEGRAVAERLLASARLIPLEGGGHLTVSVGLAAWRAGESADALVARADGALYAAKRGGRNRLEIAGASPGGAT